RHLDFVLEWLGSFGFTEFEADLSTRPEKYVGDLDLWAIAEQQLAAALDEVGQPYTVAEGEGAFYGPKIDVHIKDAIGRRWQMSTIQADFSHPERFDLTYAGKENAAERPVMIHCAKAGSLERFFGVLTEHYAGAFPTWLAPVQAQIVPVADRHNDYAWSVRDQMKAAGLRAEVDESDETVGEKVRRAITHKTPAVLVVGDKDVESGTSGYRRYGDDDEKRGVAVDEIIAELSAEAEPPTGP
ncbi:MAG: threonine--tRNA ligase, partial [Acidimicrobiia bacterium]